MGARQKLNVAYGYMCLFIAGLIGLIAQNWGVFWIMLILSLAACCHGGEIRPARRGR